MELKKLAPWNWLKHDQKNDPFKTMQTDMHKMMREFADPSDVFNRFDFSPSLNIKDRGDEYLVTMEIPGVDKQDVKIDIHDDIMHISGEKKMEKEDKDGEYYHRESRYGRFERVLHLPLDADHERMSAEFNRGVLNVNIAKTAKTDKTKRTLEIR